MRLSIIIVNYKTRQLLIDCIRSINQFDTSGTEIIVVDNFSQDDTEQALRQHFPPVRFIQMGYNAGFARANNAGIKAAQGATVLLLNSDTLVRGNAIQHALAKLLAAPGYCACGVQLLNADGSPQISGNFAMRGGLNYLLPLPYLGNFLKWIAGLFGMKKPNVPEATGMVEVDWINGAFLMVRQEAIRKAGMLDEDFFLYAEEAEWCSRLKKTGKLCIFGDEHVVHLQGESATTAFQSSDKGYFNIYDRKGLQIMLSNMLRIRKQFGVGWYLFSLFIHVLEIPLFFTGLLFDSIISLGKPRYLFGKLRGFTVNVFRLIGFAPRILANKPYFYKVL